MKKMKKFFSMLLTLAMVLGLSLTTFAAGDASITVNGLTPDDNTVLKIWQIAALDAENSAWAVTDEAYADYVDFTKDPATVDWNGLKTVVPDQDGTTVNAGSYTFDNLEIGLYLITAVGDNTAYSVMGTNTYEYDATTNLIIARDVDINAKGEGYALTKTLTDAENDAFVVKGEEVEFDINMVFPSYGVDTVDRTYSITDTPTGMKITAVSVKVNNVDVTEGTDYTVSALDVADQAVTVTFTDSFIGTENTHAGQSVAVHVTAVITGDTTYTNIASSNKGSNTPRVDGNLGSIRINKTDEAGNSLTGARFTVDQNDTALGFVFVGEVEGVATYTLKTADVEGTAVTELGTDTASSIVVKGLGDGTYGITETVAPAGYSVVTVDDVTLADGDEESRNAVETVIDTQLSSLPSTGGIGTTIFTVGGCAIMIIAAGLYFSLRRRTAK